MNVPSEMMVILDFKAASLDMIIVEYGTVGEQMTYSVKDSIITLTKSSGNSPYIVGDSFKVKYLIKDDKLFISNLDDACEARVEAWNPEPFIRVKQ